MINHHDQTLIARFLESNVKGKKRVASSLLLQLLDLKEASIVFRTSFECTR